MADNEDPLFNLDDYVPPGGGLPDHLKGKSAEEVAQYYSSQLVGADEKVKNRPPTKELPPKREAQDGPLKQSDVAPAMGTMIASARMVAKANLDGDNQKLFDRFFKEISDVMNAGFRGVQLADAQNWIFAFNQVVGSKASLLMKEAKDNEISRRTAESSSGGRQEPEVEVELTPVQIQVADSLGLGVEGYKKGIKTMREDSWPLTFSNRP